MRRAAKVDDNQTEIVKALRLAGYSVCVTSSVGDGFTDLIVGKPGVNLLMEVKDGKLPPSRKRLTPMQIKFHRDWKGPICVVDNVDDALLMIEAARNE